MLWAEIENVRVAPQPGLRASCPICTKSVIAKCGSQRVYHWAHEGKRICDRWWEPETEWHRAWKLRFPESWHECVRHDASGEKHIADVRTPYGVVIEFQHSHLHPEERAARELFYRDMIWVVDGTRLRRDLPRFLEGARALRPLAKGVFFHSFPAELLPKSWLGGRAPIFFDFGDPEDPAAAALVQGYLWGLLPQTQQRAIVVKIAREVFIRIARDNSKALLLQHLRIDAERKLAEEHARETKDYLRTIAEMMRQQRPWRPRRHWRPTRSRRRTF